MAARQAKNSQRVFLNFPESFSVKEEQFECKEEGNLNSTFSLLFFFFFSVYKEALDNSNACKRVGMVD